MTRTSWRMSLVVLAALLLLALAGCGAAATPTLTPTAMPILPTATPTEQPDKATFDKYFASISLGTDSVTRTSTMSVGDQVCVTMDIISRTDRLSLKIYDSRTGRPDMTLGSATMTSDHQIAYVNGAWVSDGGVSTFCGKFTLGAGSYEYRVSINNVLVAVLPFEVK